MTTILTFSVPIADCALHGAFERIPDLECELDRTVASRQVGAWFAGAPRSEIDRALAEDPTIDSHARVVERDDEWLYAIELAADVVNVPEIVVTNGGTLIEGTARASAWTFSARFRERCDVEPMYSELRERGLPVQVHSLRGVDGSRDGSSRLTAEQYEALEAALDRGFFEIPRLVSMGELADDLGISHQAVSERLRRAHKILAAPVVFTHESAPEVESKARN